MDNLTTDSRDTYAGANRIRVSRNELRIWQRAGVIFLIFIALQALFFLSSVCASSLPKDAILQHIEDSQGSSLTQYFDYGQTILGSNVSFDNNRFIESFAEQDDYDGDVFKASALNLIDDTMPGIELSFEYFRYWHGWRLPIFLLLMIGNLSFVSMVLGLFALGSALFFLFQLRRYIGWIPAIVFSLVAFFSTNIIGNFMGDMLLSLSISTIVLFCTISLKVGSNPNKGIFWQDCICFTSACLFCFLDFFTIPSYAIAMAVLSGMLASGCLKGSFKQGFLLFIRFAFIFLIGFVLTWASKWAFAACYMGISPVIANITGEVNLWSSSTTDGPAIAFRDRFPSIFALVASGAQVLVSSSPDRIVKWNIAGIIGFAVFLVGLVLIVVSLFQRKKLKERIANGAWSMLLPAAFIPLAIILISHHTIFHIGIFGYKPWAFFLADIACVGFYMFLRSRSRDVDDA